MPRIAFVNGRYEPLADASVSVEDRGFQFADSVYEVVSLKEGRALDLQAHFDRLHRSLAAIQITAPTSDRVLRHIVAETARRNGVSDGLIYIQVTRGAARRDHTFPRAGVRPTLVITVRPLSWAALRAKAAKGISVVTQKDLRWARCDIKTTGLLPNVLAKQAACLAGATEAWFVDSEGYITEGASSNAWIVEPGGRVVTRVLASDILPGITRKVLIDILRAKGVPVEERPFTVADVHAASEAFNSSAANFVVPVVRIDNQLIGTGKPGPVTMMLFEAYQSLVHGDALFSRTCNKK